MREDMFKVIVERPRRGGSHARPEAPVRITDLEDGGPARAPLRAPRHRSKSLNENLSPLYRFLEKSVGRPWDKVHAEACEHLHAGNVVQQHVLQHLTDQVAIRTEWRDGEVWVIGHRWGGSGPLGRSRFPMYVHPVSGVLLENRAYTHRRKLKHQRQEGAAARRMQEVRYLAPGIRLQRLNGIWFELRMIDASFAPADQAGPDTVLVKRQLGKKELRKLGISGG